MTDSSNSPDYINAEGIYSLPILHYTLECAQIVRRTIEELSPDVIAVEYPKSLETPIKKAIARLPYLTALTYETRDKTTYTIPIEPADPLAEAVRYGMEEDIPLAFVDVDVDQYPAHRDFHPDPYAIFRIGLSRYYQSSYPATAPRPTSDRDRMREKGMAYHLQQLKNEYKKILFICGMSHLGPVHQQLQSEQAAPLQTVKRKVRLFNIHPESSREIMGVYPFLSALYEQWRGSSPLEEIKRKPGEIKQGNLTMLRGGGDRITYEDRIVNLIIDKGSELNLAKGIDRWEVQRKLFEAVCCEYQTNTGQEVVRWQEFNFFRFGRNYALVEGGLLPDFFQMVLAAKSCVDENFCYEFWNVGSFYPWQEDASRLPTIRITPEMLFLGDQRLRIRPHFGARRSQPLPVSFRKRIKEKRPGEWSEKFHDKDAICSYRKEDFVLEDYGLFLKRKGTKILQEEHSHTEPFTTSIYDGIDLKTTLRHWYERKIFVKLNRNIRGTVGSVVLIFDDEEEDRQYPYCVTWLGEDEQESDQAFYATSRDAQLVGPGITRHEYGGFLLSYPPRRLYDVWRDPNYRFIRSKAQRLLVAGIEYAQERYVVYVAPSPPCSRIKSYASHMGRSIIYIPLSQLSPSMVKKIRVFHVLAGHATREIASDYIW